jgi:hypothetical protein
MKEITWGDTVRVKEGASIAARPGAIASVCGMRTIALREEALQHHVTLGTKLYLIEFGDGTSTEVPEAWVEPSDPSDV